MRVDAPTALVERDDAPAIRVVADVERVAVVVLAVEREVIDAVERDDALAVEREVVDAVDREALARVVLPKVLRALRLVAVTAVR